MSDLKVTSGDHDPDDVPIGHLVSDELLAGLKKVFPLRPPIES